MRNSSLTLAGTTAISGTGNAAANVIGGNLAANLIEGLAGDDTLLGSSGNYVLNGMVGNDMLAGGGGGDTLAGGMGENRLTGGNGSERFRLVTPGTGTEAITDFTTGSDWIKVVAANFGLVAGESAVLVVNGTPGSSAAAFIYTSATGLPAFDADGNGPGAAGRWRC